MNIKGSSIEPRRDDTGVTWWEVTFCVDTAEEAQRLYERHRIPSVDHQDRTGTPTKAIVFENGAVMVFNEEAGTQCPEYQGQASVCLPRLLNDFPDCSVVGDRWRKVTDE